MASLHSQTRKSRRITQACDFCHRRGLRCKPQVGHETGHETGHTTTCLTCLEYGQPCTRLRQPKKRGTRPRRPAHVAHDDANTASALPVTAPLATGHSPDLDRLHDRKVVTALLDIYLDTVHPIFPLFCERELWVGWRDGTFPATPSQDMTLMSMCALCAQHAQDGALFNIDLALAEWKAYAKDYLAEAVRLVPVDYTGLADLDLYRCYGFLALLGTQVGNTNMAHKYLGLYLGLSSRNSFHDELRWPPDMDICGREVRRRLFWIMYRVEVHTACVLGHLIRIPEAQCNVGYPSGTHHPAFVAGRDGQFEDWFAGWNATTDLYRLLEHAIVNFRIKRNAHNTRRHPMQKLDAKYILDELSQVQNKLLPQFGQVLLKSSDSGRNRCGFQATNIFCTIRLVRLLAIISEGATIQSVSDIAQDMIDSMNSIPKEYVRAIGAPLLRELSGVGHILISVASKEHLSIRDQCKLSTVLLAIADFLEGLKEHNSTSESQAMLLRQHVNKLCQEDPALSQDEPSDQGDPGHLFSWSPYMDDLLQLTYTGPGAFSTSSLRDLTWLYPDSHE